MSRSGVTDNPRNRSLPPRCRIRSISIVPLMSSVSYSAFHGSRIRLWPLCQRWIVHERLKKLEQQGNPPPPPRPSQDREKEEIRSNRATGAKSSETRRANAPAAGGKLAFSLKPKAKIAIALVKLGGDEEEHGDEAGCSNDSSKRRKLSRMGTDESAVQHGDGGNSPSFA